MRALLCTSLLLAATLAAAQSPAPSAEAPFDVVIANGHIVDGTGSPWYSGDVGIRDGRIAAIGKLDASARKLTIDARGHVVAPGFIDMLGQSELSMLVDPRLPSKIYQGITTEVTGEGDSAGPLNEAMLTASHNDYEHLGLKPEWRTLGGYFSTIERHGMGINLASYVGATTVRRMVLGEAAVDPTPDELRQMQALVEEAMREGAVGVSSSLQYSPAPYAKTAELIALAQSAAKFGGIYATHMRSEGAAEREAIEETIRIGREARIPVEIWHLKAAGRASWGTMPAVVAQIQAAREAGVDIAADTYAYPAWFNTFSAFIPPWAHDGGDQKLIERLRDPATRARIRREMETPSAAWENEWLEVPGPESIAIGVVQNDALKPLQGKKLSEVAALWHEDAFDALCDILIKDRAFTMVAVFGINEQDIAVALKQPWVSVDNDSQGTSLEGLLGTEHPHPRAYGTFPRILRRYVREEKLLTLEDAVRKFTALPAQRMGFADRGALKLGLAADVVVFDAATIRDRASFEQPNQLSEGMEYVLVNGVPVIAEGRMTGKLPGRVLRGPGYAGQ
jgi:N-acyl-D-amino-acid deacylase